MKEGASRSKREVAELAKIQMCYVPGSNQTGVNIRYSDTYLMFMIKHMRTVKLKSY